MKLVIVESPTKAKTLSKFLGSGYKIEASMGHVRDLPKSKLGVDTEKDFKPEYVVVKGKAKIVASLRKAAKGVDEVILATDQDREGEAIAFHVQYLLGDKHKFSRIVFHEITKTAILGALKKKGKVNIKLLEAQQARRILDRLVGYKLSPVLWRKVRRGLSAGRVQSVAVRLVVEKEKEIKAFKPQEYWEIQVKLLAEKGELLVDLNKIENKKVKIDNSKQANEITDDLKRSEYKIVGVKKRETKRQPVPPFMTSTMQRIASTRLGYSAKKTMREAQQLYEKGLITYHRTDSFNLASSAVAKVRKYIAKEFGKEYLPEKPRFYKSKSKSAQGAHEAIRPTKVGLRAVDSKSSSSKLYSLIWERFVASQMMPAIFDKTVVKVEGKGKKTYELKAKGERLKFLGWLKVNSKFKETNEDLAIVNEGDLLQLIKVLPEQKFTQAPTRYNEAGLIKVLERKGIGRPSTYAPIISTIQLRQYVERKEKRLYPTAIGDAVTEFLVKYFTKVMDYEFTAEMEEGLDKVAEGKQEWIKLLSNFYGSFEKRVEKVIEKSKRVKIAVEKTGQKCPKCKKGEVIIRTGRFGKFLSCSNFPECKYTATYKQIVEGVKCEKCGGEVVIKKSRKGRQFYGCSNYPKCKWASWKKPK
ncbi:MAG: type I DNA topoisomerase [Patescibacteria group bacterium]|nr:type I DNA topoisomerase [Patescibacteria group bacterium]